MTERLHLWRISPTVDLTCRYEEPDIDVQLSSEVPGSLRSLKVHTHVVTANQTAVLLSAFLWTVIH